MSALQSQSTPCNVLPWLPLQKCFMYVVTGVVFAPEALSLEHVPAGEDRHVHHLSPART